MLNLQQVGSINVGVNRKVTINDVVKGVVTATKGSIEKVTEQFENTQKTEITRALNAVKEGKPLDSTSFTNDNNGEGNIEENLKCIANKKESEYTLKPEFLKAVIGQLFVEKFAEKLDITFEEASTLLEEDGNLIETATVDQIIAKNKVEIEFLETLLAKKEDGEGLQALQVIKESTDLSNIFGENIEEKLNNARNELDTILGQTQTLAEMEIKTGINTEAIKKSNEASQAIKEALGDTFNLGTETIGAAK